jgi:hypothetical protein
MMTERAQLLIAQARVEADNPVLKVSSSLTTCRFLLIRRLGVFPPIHLYW